MGDMDRFISIPSLMSVSSVIGDVEGGGMGGNFTRFSVISLFVSQLIFKALIFIFFSPIKLFNKLKKLYLIYFKTLYHFYWLYLSLFLITVYITIKNITLKNCL